MRNQRKNQIYFFDKKYQQTGDNLCATHVKEDQKKFPGTPQPEEKNKEPRCAAAARPR